LQDIFTLCPNLKEIKGVPEEDEGVRQTPEFEKINELIPSISRIDDIL
jgi:hypothetical protein